jgi:hypothetical protein
VAITKSWERSVVLKLAEDPAPRARRREGVWLGAASILAAFGLTLVCAAKMAELSNATARIAHGELVNLNAVSSAEQMEPFLAMFADAGSRQDAADKVFRLIQESKRIPNVGALARVRVNGKRLPISRIKPLMVVRTPREFLTQYVLWCCIYLAAFWMVHWIWRARRFRGDPVGGAFTDRDRIDSGGQFARSAAGHARVS